MNVVIQTKHTHTHTHTVKKLTRPLIVLNDKDTGHLGVIKAAWSPQLLSAGLKLADRMGKIVFYEDRNFQGRSYECSNECSDLHSHFNRCNSIRVDNGAWMVYERPNYTGYQYFLRKGDYPDYQRWMGFNDCVRSCRVIPMHQGSHKMMIYERNEFGGQKMELTDDCPSLYERFHFNDVNSCNVMDGHWIFYEHPHYRGRQYLMRPGEYRRFHEWGGVSPRVGSIKRITM